jgi:phage terminase large subunit
VDINTTNVYERNAEALRDKRRALNEGGTASSKTYSIIQLLILVAQYTKKKLLISIVSESLPHLKRGCIRDFKSIMAESFDDSKYNKSEQVYHFGLGTVEFFPADEPSKMRGGRRDILFINEANNVAYDAFRELDVRTRLFTFLDWNPVSEFWAHENLLNKPENQYIHSTYLDAIDVLPKEVVANIESNKGDPNWWNVYGLGRIGKVEGLVYPLFDQAELPERGDVIFGLDFGFSGDPASLTKNIITPLEIYSEELMYETNLTNQDISARMTDLGLKKHFDLIYADSAEPKSIEELCRMGWNVKPVTKGPGSVEFGHQAVRQRKQHWTTGSLNCIKEQRNFRYIQDKMGRYTERTTHQFSHGMDSRRYAVMGITEPPEPQNARIIFDSMKLIEDMDL